MDPNSAPQTPTAEPAQEPAPKKGFFGMLGSLFGFGKPKETPQMPPQNPEPQAPDAPVSTTPQNPPAA